MSDILEEIVNRNRQTFCNADSSHYVVLIYLFSILPAYWRCFLAIYVITLFATGLIIAWMATGLA